MTFCIHHEPTASGLSLPMRRRRLLPWDKSWDKVPPPSALLLRLVELHLSSVQRLQAILAGRLAQEQTPPERPRQSDPPPEVEGAARFGAPYEFLLTAGLDARLYDTADDEDELPSPYLTPVNGTPLVGTPLAGIPKDRASPQTPPPFDCALYPVPRASPVPQFTVLALDVIEKRLRSLDHAPPPTSPDPAASLPFLVGRERNA